MKRKPGSCFVCVEVSQSETDLKAHILSCHVVSVFLCDLCHRIFYQEIDVNEHVTSHLDVKHAMHSTKPEITDIAHISNDSQGVNDSDASSLLSHACDMCYHAFSTTSDLKAHILTHGVGNKTSDGEDLLRSFGDAGNSQLDVNVDIDFYATPASSAEASKCSRAPKQKISRKDLFI